MDAIDFINLCMSKRAAAIMTPQAQQAAAMPPPQGAPMDPSMMGAPVDPAMMGAPQGAPVDPAMMGAPQGAPVDPAMMGAPQGAPMDPSMMGAPMDPAMMAQQMFPQFLQEALGITFDPQTGQAFDPQGQPVPPQALTQLFMQFQQQLQAQLSGGAPMDPSMMGAPQGAPVDPAMMAQGQQQQSSDMLNQFQSVVRAELAAQDKKIAAMMDKMDSIKSMLQSLVGTRDTRTTQDKVSQQELDNMLQQQLIAQGQAAAEGTRAPVQPVALPQPTEQVLGEKRASQNSGLTLLQKIKGIRGV